MANTTISLDIVMLVMDELVYDTAQYSDTCGSPPGRKSQETKKGEEEKESGSPPWVTLKRCARACKLWRPLAQQRLFRKLRLHSPQMYYTSRRRQPDLRRFYEVVESNSSLFRCIQVLDIKGQWFAHHSYAPLIIDLLSEHGRLRSFLWDMGCHRGCGHWSGFPPDFQRSMVKLFEGRDLTAVTLRGLCFRFPLQLLGRAPLRHVELAGDFVQEELVTEENLPIIQPRHWETVPTHQVQPLSLNLNGPATHMLPFYLDRSDFNLKFDKLNKLTINAFDTLELASNILKRSRNTIETLTWKYKPIFVDRDEMEEIDYYSIPLRISLNDLINVQTINIHASLSSLYLDSYHSYRGYKHFVILARILGEYDFPKSMETLNIIIDHCPNVFDLGLGIDPHENLHRDLIALDIDRKLAYACSKAHREGQLKAVVITIVIRELRAFHVRFDLPDRPPPEDTITESEDTTIDVEEEYSIEAELDKKMVSWFRRTREAGFLRWNVVHYDDFGAKQDVW